MKTLTFILFSILTAFFFPLYGQEICDNAIDDDGDGLIDLNDTIECNCAILLDSISTGVISSLIPNPSFENYNCIPTSFGQMDCADDWIQASNATSDFWYIDSSALGYGYYPTFNYGLSAPAPIPDGNGFVGFINSNGYQEYIGACLTNPILQDSSYTFQFSFGFSDLPGFNADPINFSFFANPSCYSLPFGNYAIDCPENYPYWVEVASINLSGNFEWIDTSITFVADANYHALVIGGSCNTTASVMSYYFLDNLVVNETSLFSLPTENIDSTKIECNHYNLFIENFSSYNIQWYLDGVALIGENSNMLEVEGDDISGSYYALVDNGAECFISNSISLANEVVPQLYTFGSSNYSFPINSNQSLELFTDASNYQLAWNNNVNLSCLDCLDPQFFATENETLFAEITDLNNFCKNTIELNIDVFSSDTAEIIDPIIEEPIQPSNCFLYMPNAFTPNNDGKNDIFEVEIGNCYKEIIEFSIFNRFGELVKGYANVKVEENNLKWNGSFASKILSTDVFYYILSVKKVTGEIENYKGNITLIR